MSADEMRDPDSFISAYARAFNSGDTEELINHYYDAPLSIIQGDRSIVLKDKGEVQRMIESSLVNLGVRHGTTTEVVNSEYCAISKHLTCVRLGLRRDFTSGETQELSYLYVLRAANSTFRIVSMIQSDPENQLVCRNADR